MARHYRHVNLIIEREGRKPFFTKCGVAFDNRDGSLNFQLHLFPGVKFHIGIPKEVNGDDAPQKAEKPDEEKPEDDVPF